MTYKELEMLYEKSPSVLAADLLEAYHPGEIIPECYARELKEVAE